MEKLTVIGDHTAAGGGVGPGNPYGASVPFKTPSEYFLNALGGDSSKIEHWDDIRAAVGWDSEDNDLHVYPHTHAVSAMLSMGCEWKCKWCPTFKHFQGTVVKGDPEKILVRYEGKSVHFMDENFMHNDLDVVLPILKRLNIKWLCMTMYPNLVKALDKYGEDYLAECGLVCVEMGLENVSLMMKCKGDLNVTKFSPYYLNLTCMPGETKETIQENAAWMKPRSLKDPIHYNNGLWYAPGQYYFTYGDVRDDGRFVDATRARVRPTYIPNSLLNQDFKIDSLSQANYYSQLVYGEKMYPEKLTGNIGEFIGTDHKKAMWMVAGIRCGAIT